jgi:hypothetical protein
MFLKRLNSVMATVILCFMLPISAQATKLAGEFLTTGFGARALGMGGAFVSVADDASAVYWNPAGLLQLDQSQILLMHSERFGDLVDYNCFSLARPLSQEAGQETAGAISIIWLRVGDIALTSHLNEPDVDFEDLNGNGIWDPGSERRYWRPDRVRMESDNEIAGFITYARRFTDKVSLGFNAKVIWKEIADITSLGFGFDAGLMYRVMEAWNIGVNLQDLTTTPLYWDGWYYAPDPQGGDQKYKVSTKESIYPTLKAGTSYIVPVAAISGNLIFAADCDFKFEGLDEDEADFSFSDISGDVRLGLLYEYKHMLGVSVGMDRRKPTAGIGVRISQFSIDYAFWRDTELDNTHRVSVSMGF